MFKCHNLHLDLDEPDNCFCRSTHICYKKFCFEDDFLTLRLNPTKVIIEEKPNLFNSIYEKVLDSD